MMQAFIILLWMASWAVIIHWLNISYEVMIRHQLAQITGSLQELK